MLKSYGWWGGVGGPCDFSVSPRSKYFFFLFLGLLFDLGACWDKGLDSDLDQGLTNKTQEYVEIENLERELR